MYPDILNLHGDRYNLLSFTKVGEDMGLEIDIKKVTYLSDKVNFNEADILFFNPGELVVMPDIISALKKDKAGIDSFVKAGKGVITIGNSMGIVANKTEREDSSFDGLQYVDVDIKEREKIYGDDLIIKREDIENNIAGIQIRSIDITRTSETPFGNIIYGLNNAGVIIKSENTSKENNGEGFIKNNIVGTNLLGPVFVKNPWLAHWYLEKISGIRANLKDYETELKSLEKIREFNFNKR